MSDWLWIVGVMIPETALLIYAARIYGKNRKVYQKLPGKLRSDAFICDLGHTLSVKTEGLRKGDRKEVLSHLVRSLGREDGEKEYTRYMSRCFGVFLILLIPMLTFFEVDLIRNKLQEATLEEALARPEHGEGGIKESLVYEAGNEKGEIEVRISEKGQPEEVILSHMNDALDLVEKALTDHPIYKDLQLPKRIGETEITYQSRNVKIIKSSGKLSAELQRERQQVPFLITASEEGRSESREIVLIVASSEETPKEDLVLQEILPEMILEEEERVVLPEKTPDGREIRWTLKKENSLGLWILLTILIPLIGYVRQKYEIREQAEKRESQFQSAYPELVSEMSILMGAGLSIQTALIRIGNDHRKEKERGEKVDYLTEEVIRCAREMEEGTAPREALENFSARVSIKEIRRFTQLLQQNLRRGDPALIGRLREMSEDAWEKRKKHVRERSEQADTKLLLPLMLMLIVILIIVLAPAVITMRI